MIRYSLIIIAFVTFGLTLTNCSSISEFRRPPTEFNESDRRFIEAYKQNARTYKIGKPYKIFGQKFYPGHDPSYDEVGIASWYGPNVGKLTANGELFNQYDIAAAHPTLPLPSIVEVTNLDNGKKIIVKVNDRGPFRHNRIIDLTKGAAQKIGMIDTGTARVRVRFLKNETLEYLIYEH